MKNYSIEKIKATPIKALPPICKSIREDMIPAVLQSGGHLASSLGCVELCAALHKTFDSPIDQFVFDVGHQAYAHKMITGRDITTLRKPGGVAPFTRPSESEHDAFIAGHSSVSISAACGIAAAKTLSGEKGKAVVIIGDGALTGGQAFEGLINAKDLKNIVIIINDNGMSISKTGGALSNLLSDMRSAQAYIRTKQSTKDNLAKIPLVGVPAANALGAVKDIVKNTVYRGNIFTDLGFSYYGVIDGHDTKDLVRTLSAAKSSKDPCVVHIKTTKGKGFTLAEKYPERFHGVSPKTSCKNSTPTPGEVFGNALCELAKNDDRIIAITAAMTEGTGLLPFAKQFPNRFFDVGIAEQHAVTFAAAMAGKGYIPVFAVYSTFLQRCFDQLIHDCSLDPLHIVLAVGRAGNLDDGDTHAGVFDERMLAVVPRTEVYNPSTPEQLEKALKAAIYDDKYISAVRMGKCF